MIVGSSFVALDHDVGGLEITMHDAGMVGGRPPAGDDAAGRCGEARETGSLDLFLQECRQVPRPSTYSIVMYLMPLISPRSWMRTTLRWVTWRASSSSRLNRRSMSRAASGSPPISGRMTFSATETPVLVPRLVDHAHPAGAEDADDCDTASRTPGPSRAVPGRRAGAHSLWRASSEAYLPGPRWSGHQRNPRRARRLAGDVRWMTQLGGALRVDVCEDLRVIGVVVVVSDLAATSRTTGRCRTRPRPALIAEHSGLSGGRCSITRTRPGGRRNLAGHIQSTRWRA